jgi:hypothetical protein
MSYRNIKIKKLKKFTQPALIMTRKMRKSLSFLRMYKKATLGNQPADRR